MNAFAGKYSVLRLSTTLCELLGSPGEHLTVLVFVGRAGGGGGGGGGGVEKRMGVGGGGW